MTRLMDEIVSISAIDQKMAEMRIKNLELLKRHQEIEEDRQLAVQSGATTTTVIENLNDMKTMRGTTKNRTRLIINQQNFQENQHERIYRPPIRRKFENDRNDTQPQRAQRVDYNRLKREHAQETNNNQNQNNNTINSELQEYAHPFHYQSKTNNDSDEPTHAKKLVIVNNKAGRIGSGRFNQQQRPQEQGQRKREERMRRCGIQNNIHTGGANEFHLDVPPVPLWQNVPMHVQLLPTTNINNHHTGIDHLVNTNGDQMDQSTYMHNYIYSSPAQATPFHGNGTVYFAHPSSSITTNSTCSQISPLSQTHFHQYNTTRTFENSNRHQFHLPSFQSSTSNNQQQDNSSTDLPPRLRRLKTPDNENKISSQRPMSGDIERLHNTQHSSSSRFNHDIRFQIRPQSFYDFSSYQQSNNNNNLNNNNSFRLSNNNRYQRNNNMNNSSLPLSAYMNTDDSLNQNENLNNNHWGISYQKRRPSQQQQQQRISHQDKHQFPLSSYDPRQYGFNNNYQKRNDFNNRSNTYRRNMNNNYNNGINNSNDVALIEEWWEDNNTELIGTKPLILNNDSNITTTTINDSGNSSLSTSMNLKETTLDDFANPSSDISTTDSNIIESLDKLQQQLKLEEAVDEQLASTNNDQTEIIDNKSNKELATYDTAHFMQWAKEKFREELTGRLTAQEIQQHDAVITDNDNENDNDDDEDHEVESTANNIEKLTIDENVPNITETIVTE